MISQTFLNSFPIVAGVMGQNLDVTVRFEGHQAATNGKVIVLPNVESVSDPDVLMGFLSHEAAHVRFTDMSVMLEIDSPLEKSLLNIYEDQRVEILIGTIYPGSIYFLAQTIHRCEKELMENLSSADVSRINPVAVLLAFLNMDCRGRVRGQLDCQSEAFISIKMLAGQFFGEPFLESLRQFDDRILTLQSTKDSHRLAQDVIGWLKRMLPNEPDTRSEPGDGQKSDSPSDEANQPDQKELSNSEKSDQPQQSGHSLKSSQSADTGEESISDSGTPSEADRVADADHLALSEAMEKLLNATDCDLDDPMDISSHLAKKLSRQIDEEVKKGLSQDALNVTDIFRFPGSNPPVQQEKRGSLPLKLYEMAKTESSALRQQLRTLLETQSMGDRRLLSSGRKLDHLKLSRLQSHNLRVFRARSVQTRVDTAVHVLLDLSSSMKDKKIIALRAALALKLALDSIKACNSALTVFPCYANRDRASQAVLLHGEKISASTLKRFAGLDVGGTTPLSEALCNVAMALSQTKEKRKIVIVITDGRPDNIAQSAEILRRLKSSGVEVFGIGIVYDVSNLFERSITIDDSRQLQTTLLGLIRKLSIGGIQ